jgi:hypothetical protein
VDWLNRADPAACGEIMHPDYTVLIGGHTLSGRDEEYVPATLGQLRRFPGLLISVAQLFTDGTSVAMRFTEHGAAADGGAPAAWGGIGLFVTDGVRLARNVTEEDYLARRRQLARGESEPVEAPAAAPWSAAPQPGDPGAEDAVRAWLSSGDLACGGAVTLDDGWTGAPTPALLDVTEIHLGELFSAGRDVAFSAVLTGAYRGGLPDTEAGLGRVATLSVVGMVSVDPGGAIRGRVIRDRVGLRRAVRS